MNSLKASLTYLLFYFFYSLILPIASNPLHVAYFYSLNFLFMIPDNFSTNKINNLNLSLEIVKLNLKKDYDYFSGKTIIT